ncbi:pyridoxal phosphate enzyme, YggS family [Leptospira inadai serovar Lyme str. 10]|uniref:Pyridoxal phosphate enzyme, YggS family n=2 Tax=Leptospira inadai serovar Lyme TaxID=293084 RepID=V6HUZ3_9LEPT|nr:YggS family pyridoxal phosphate-dependent enzyme [Leptospira inadai]EQA36624.1 pyridoxal phosphate enzyme, YggS family [Leptospira inadai serovar Lyme str. 10]PNV76474.1 YggS family pyridoxal phosphate-dependent enzyme [Leptospira inadai serovar Lyme]
MGVLERYLSLRSEIESIRPENPATIIAVSKFQPKEKVVQAISGGCLHFGENRVQEGWDKFADLGTAGVDFILHHIGPLQSGTLRKYAGFYSYAHGVGSVAALEELRKRLEKDRWRMGIFLQANLTEETSKSGFSRSQLLEFLGSRSSFSSEFCRIEGLMTMGPSSGEEEMTRKVFHELGQIRKDYFPEAKLSMGMSGDYKIAVSEGSDYIRIGSAIFGERS